LLPIPQVHLDATQETALFHGKVLTGFSTLEERFWRAYGVGQRFLGLVRSDGRGQLKAERLFVSPSAGQKDA
jgi:hypothetical protein